MTKVAIPKNVLSAAKVACAEAARNICSGNPSVTLTEAELAQLVLDVVVSCVGLRVSGESAPLSADETIADVETRFGQPVAS